MHFAKIIAEACRSISNSDGPLYLEWLDSASLSWASNAFGKKQSPNLYLLTQDVGLPKPWKKTILLQLQSSAALSPKAPGKWKARLVSTWKNLPRQDWTWGVEKAHLWKYGNDKFQTKNTHIHNYTDNIYTYYYHMLLICVYTWDTVCILKNDFPYTCWELIPHMESHKSALLSAAVRLGNCLGLQRSMFVSS